MTAQALEQSVLESKDKAQLIAIAEALGVKASTRNKKSEIIDQILQMTGAPRPDDAAPAPVASNGHTRTGNTDNAPAAAPVDDGPAGGTPDRAPTSTRATDPVDEPKAEWELDLGDTADVAGDRSGDESSDGDDEGDTSGDHNRNNNAGPRRDNRSQGDRGGQFTNGQGGQPGDDSENRNKRRRRRRKNRGPQDAGPQGDDREQFEDEVIAGAPVSLEPVSVEGYLDLRDEGYGFIRVNNYLASKSDSYVPVKLSRQYGLRRATTSWP